MKKERKSLRDIMKKRLILITIDCWRYDRLKIYNYSSKVLPNINKICKDSVIFENMISNSSNTAPSFYALFTSKIPVIDGTYSPLPEDQIQFTEILKNYGIKTCAIHSNPHLGRFCNYNIGFKDFFDLLEAPRYSSLRKKLFSEIYKLFEILKLRKYITKIKEKFLTFLKLRKYTPSLAPSKLYKPYATAKETTLKAIRWIKNNMNSDLFLWIHYMDAHRPYFPPKKYLKLITKKEIPDTTKIYIKEVARYFKPFSEYKKKIDKQYVQLTNILYDAELRYIDHYIGILFAFLKSMNLFATTDIILTADHGESIFEHNFIGHQVSLYDILLKIPLIIKLNQFQTKTRIIDKPVELIDLAPTILALFNIPKNEDFRGSSLVPLILEDLYPKEKEFIVSALLHNNNLIFSSIHQYHLPFYPMVSIRLNKWKLIYDAQYKNYELYNLKQDPKEKMNIYHSNNNNILLIRDFLERKIISKLSNYYSEEQKIKRVVNRILK